MLLRKGESDPYLYYDLVCSTCYSVMTAIRSRPGRYGYRTVKGSGIHRAMTMHIDIVSDGQPGGCGRDRPEEDVRLIK